MSCSICSRAPHSRLSFYCPTCARNQLYQLRIDSTQVLLEKEALGKQIEVAVTCGSPWDRPSSHRQELVDTSKACSSRWVLQTIDTRHAVSLTKRELVTHQLEVLKLEVEAKKARIIKQKEALARRQSDAESAKFQLEERETGILAGVQNSSKRVEHVWHSLHSKTAESRIYLCREVANLYGLRKATKKGQRRETYVLGCGFIVDLRDMNGTPQEQISTSFSNIAHLLIIVSHYLSLKLPAEITLPHKNYPVPTIYTPSASYRSRDGHDGADFQSSSSPAASRTVDPRNHTPRPRPLSIDKPLPRLAKEDPAAYAFFLEGATLLAWNVAWLCRTQGINLSSDSWEEVCDIGKSLWQLLVAPPAHPSTLMRAFAGRDTQTQIKSAKDTPRTTIQRTTSFPMLGHYSHGTAHSFLGASEGVEFMRMWKLPTPTKIVDKLKSNLLGEMASAEWELLEEIEWDDAAMKSPRPSAAQNPKVFIPSQSGTVETDRSLKTRSRRTPGHEDGSSPRLGAQQIRDDNKMQNAQDWQTANDSTSDLKRAFSAISEIPDTLLRAELLRRDGASDDTSACGSKQRGDYNTPLHVMALFLILGLSTFACSFPVLARRFPRLPIPRRFLFISRHFGTGVLIATAFVHLLPTAFVSLTDPCLPRFWSQTYRAMPGFVAMISVFAVVIVEMFFAMKGAKHVHGSEYDNLIGEVERDSRSDGEISDVDYSGLEARRVSDNINLDSMGHNSKLRTTRPFGSFHEPDRLHLADSSLDKEDDGDDLDGLDDYMDDDGLINGQAAHSAQPRPVRRHRPRLLQCLLLEAGILFHSIFIGMALSVATGTSFVVLLIAISFHQTFEGFALGSRIASLIPDLFAPNSTKPWLMSLAYGTTTPLGQAIGLVLHNLYDPASATGLLMVGITNAISSGLLLFAGLVELLAEDFLSESSYETLKGRRRVEACVSVACGALLMAFVGAFA
ncbi:Zip-domain-containing protein [Penicillium digitatum]|uniref:Autophagy-related protein 14 n=1 Tax=Penicillium digitatum TaxID=36651 RepID=A0A7T6XQG3_PENDI|nr:Zip-domain-containing protein [Penicillium digitatum]